MGYVFMHMGCDLDLAKDAAFQVEGVTLEGGQYDGCKFSAEDGAAEAEYFRHYTTLFERKFLFPVGYMQISTAKEDTEVLVMWGNILGAHEFGSAIRKGNDWYILGQANEFANGKPCATPTAWNDK